MATIQNQYNEEEDKKDQGAAETLSTSQNSGPTGTTQSGGGSPAASSGSQYRAPERKGSGRFMNLQKYLDANQGSGERLASGIADSTQRQASQFEKKAGEQSSKIAENIQSEKDRLGRASGYNQQIQQGQAANVAGTQQGIDEYTQLRTGQNDLH